MFDDPHLDPTVPDRRRGVMLVMSRLDDRNRFDAMFTAAGWATRAVGSAAEAVAQTAANASDVYVIQLDLPDAAAPNLCRRLRGLTRNPVIMVGDPADERAIVDALDAGADDFVDRACSAEYAVARVRVAYRHLEVLSAVLDVDLVRAGDLWADVAGHCAGVGDRTVVLPAKQFAVLAILLRNWPKVVPYRTFETLVWHGDAGNDALRICVAHLRRVLRDAGSPFLPANERLLGYRLVESAEILASE